MSKKIAIMSIIVICMTLTIAPVNASQGKEKDKAEILYKVVTKLMSKGDEAVIGLGRILKAETYFKKMNQPDKAIEEINKLEEELTDPELLFAANTIKMLILKKTEEDPSKFISSIDGIIGAAKTRLGQK